MKFQSIYQKYLLNQEAKMDTWQDLLAVVNGYKEDLAREAKTARALRDANGSSSKSGWLLRLVGLTIILIGLIVAWAY